jgi:hypothetical protein
MRNVAPVFDADEAEVRRLVDQYVSMYPRADVDSAVRLITTERIKRIERTRKGEGSITVKDVDRLTAISKLDPEKLLREVEEIQERVARKRRT